MRRHLARLWQGMVVAGEASMPVFGGPTFSVHSTPMHATIVKRFSFEAAHQLVNHDGKCRNRHGHSYVVEVGVTGPVNEKRGVSDEGMVVDFADVSAVFKDRVHAVCDHRDLNEVLPVPVTTAEWIAAWILETMRAVIPQVTFVRVWETTSSYAEVR